MTNNFTIVGHYASHTRDRVTKLIITVPERRKDRDTGEWETTRMPVSVTVFGDRLNALLDNIEGDVELAVTGRVTGREWQDKVYDDLVATDIVAGGNANDRTTDRAASDRLDDIPF